MKLITKIPNPRFLVYIEFFKSLKFLCVACFVSFIYPLKRTRMLYAQINVRAAPSSIGVPEYLCHRIKNAFRVPPDRRASVRRYGIPTKNPPLRAWSWLAGYRDRGCKGTTIADLKFEEPIIGRWP